MVRGTVRSDLVLGIDVGSTTVKCVVVGRDLGAVLWRRYERHEARQAEKVAEMLAAIEADLPAVRDGSTPAFITGSGGGPLTKPLGARYVQEVNAVTIAAERLHPEVNSVIELGGQDAKFILFRANPDTGERNVLTTMNDKCASGTGATIDKCIAKVGIDRASLAAVHFDPSRLHRVAARCGVFAETDVVNLIKAGVPSGEVMSSLGDAIVMQNLTVLTRGNTLRPKVMLLGGPNTFLPFLQESWKYRIAQLWQERGVSGDDVAISDLVFVPDDSLYFAALGSAYFGMTETGVAVTYGGLGGLRSFIATGRRAQLGESAGPPLFKPGESIESFRRAYTPPPFIPPEIKMGDVVCGYIGLDGGSTTSKAVLIDETGELVTKEYLISGGNPIADIKGLLATIRDWVRARGATLDVKGVGVTGYAADVLDAALHVDANVVETIAHMLSAKRYCGDDIDVICDIGGQDIKVMFLQNGAIKNFRLSTQCSAGNGMLLQSMADQFGVPISEFADVAFKAELSPVFSSGCAVFLDTDRVNFQKEGYTREELFAGLAMVLPKNIWQYVVQIPRLAELGHTFVLQGGAQRNLAALKAEVDYIKERVPNARVLLHPHCGEAGAIGAALEARRIVARRGRSTFIGLESAIGLDYTTRTDEGTRCHFCANECLRTFIDIRAPDGKAVRYIAGFSCERGTVESEEAVQRINAERKRLMDVHPNLLAYEADSLFRRRYKTKPIPEAGSEVESRKGPFHRRSTRPFERSGEEAAARRRGLRIGIPRILASYSLAPFFRAYLEAIGIESRNIVFSEETTRDMWIEGGRYAAIDPCYPSKAALAHVYRLVGHAKGHRPLDYLWFPAVKTMTTYVSHVVDSTSCPVVSGTPKVVAAALTKEKDLFAAAHVEYVTDILEFDDPRLLEGQLFATWSERLGITADENAFALGEGYAAMKACDADLEARGRSILDKAVAEDQVVLLVLCRSYHADAGMNHGIPSEFQALGYPLITMRSIPKDQQWLTQWFAPDLADGRVSDVMDVRDVWPENYSAASVQRVWAAKFAARHPNVAVLDLSSFKCGNDAVAFSLTDRILAESRTPSMALHDLDINKPGQSIKIRVRTFAYALGLYQEAIADRRKKETELARRVAAHRQAQTAASPQRELTG